MMLEIQERGYYPSVMSLEKARETYPDIDDALMSDEGEDGWIVFNDGQTQVRPAVMGG